MSHQYSGVKFAMVVHRGMGCTDEASSDAEQAEKILYFHPTETSMNEKLTKINMLEGLIDFTSKFSTENIGQ